MLLRRLFTGVQSIRSLSLCYSLHASPYFKSTKCFSAGEEPFFASTGFDEDKVKSLVSNAIRLQENSGVLAGSVYPDEALTFFVRYYKASLAVDERHKFFSTLSEHFGIQEADVDKHVKLWSKVKSNSSTPEARLRVLGGLAQSTQPLYASLFLPLSRLPNGLEFLVDLRGDLLELIMSKPQQAFHMRALSNHLRGRLAEWFNVGLLRLEQLTWSRTSAELLEKVMENETVHPIGSWMDLKKRFAPDKRVFAFFHPSMSSQPLVVLHVALMGKVPSKMVDIVPAKDSGDAAKGNSANPKVGVFYSISATKPGLSGIELGNFLIKQVALRIQRENPSVGELVTLSPLPNFRSWLLTKLTKSLEEPPEKIFTETFHNAAFSKDALLRTLTSKTFTVDASHDGILKPILLKLAAWYLVVEKRRNLALDPVAHFHLKNGAWLSNIHWRADDSSLRLSQSLGIMVNYTYKLNDVLANNKSYLLDHKLAVEPHVYKALDLGEGRERELFIA